MAFISKSKYLSGLQCSKLLWHQYNAKHLLPPFDESTQAVFDQGHEVGRLAKSLFPGGIEVVGEPKDFSSLFRNTSEALVRGRPVFEASFKHKDGFCRVDILVPAAGKSLTAKALDSARARNAKIAKDAKKDGKEIHRRDPPQRWRASARDAENDDGLWDIVEVKSSTQVKDVNLHDLALQRYVVEGSGVRVRKCILMFINNRYVRKGEVEPEQLFATEDVTDQVADLLPDVEKNLAAMQRVVSSKSRVEVAIGPHCDDPYECIMKEICWKHVPEDSPLSLYRFNKVKAFELVNGGVLSAKRLPADVELNEKQEIQVQALKTGKAIVNPDAIQEFLEKLEYPLFFLDFETFMTAVPMYDGVRPYQQVPFQFSLHVQRKVNGKVEHHSWLATGETDPRPEMLKRLKKLLENTGSIVAYNASFEITRLREAAEEYPEYDEWVNEVSERVVDLLEPFRGFSYYHPKQHGSASIKSVLPALVGKTYEGMEISEGGEASREYMRVTFEDVRTEERKKVRASLEEYCAQDTMAMVELVLALGYLTKGS